MLVIEDEVRRAGDRHRREDRAAQIWPEIGEIRRIWPKVVQIWLGDRRCGRSSRGTAVARDLAGDHRGTMEVMQIWSIVGFRASGARRRKATGRTTALDLGETAEGNGVRERRRHDCAARQRAAEGKIGTKKREREERAERERERERGPEVKMQQRFNMAGRGPSPVIPLLLMVLTLVLVMNGWGGDGGRRETCNGGRSGGGSGRSVFSSIRGLPAVVIAIVGIHYFLSVMLPSYHVFPAAGNRQGDADEGYGLGTLLFLALFLILYNFF